MKTTDREILFLVLGALNAKLDDDEDTVLRELAETVKQHLKGEES